MVTEQIIASGTAVEQHSHQWNIAIASHHSLATFAVSPLYLQTHRQLPALVERSLRSFPEIQSVYKRQLGDTLEYYVLADFSQRERENAYYAAEAELLQMAPRGSLAIILVNSSNFERKEPFAPPSGSVPVQVQVL